MVAARMVLQASMVRSRLVGSMVMVPWMTSMPTVVVPLGSLWPTPWQTNAGSCSCEDGPMGDDSTTDEAPARAAYPPDKHFLRDLDSQSWQVTVDRALMSAPLTDGYRNAAGSAALGFLAALVDIAAAPVALIAATPDWTATQDMSLHAAGWL